MKAPAPASTIPPRRWQDAVLVLAIVGVGVVASALVHRSMREAEAQRLQVRAAAAANEVLGDVELALTRTVEAVRSAGLMVESQPGLSRPSFMRYAAQLTRELPAVGMLEWQPLVRGSEREAFEREAQAQGLVGYAIQEPTADGQAWQAAPVRDRYVPILYGWPEGKAPLGYNLAQDPVRMASKDEAARLGRPLASGSFPILRQDIGAAPVTGFAITAPVYALGPGAQGQPLTRGFLAAVVELPVLFAGAQRQAERGNVALWVYEGPKPAGPLLFASAHGGAAPQTSGREADLQRVATVDVAGQAWTLVLQPQAALLQEGTSVLPHVVLGLGLLVSGLLGLAFDRVARERARAQAARASLARESQRLSNVLDGTQAAAWERNLVTGETHVNAQWERLAGYEPGEHPIGPDYDWRQDCHPDDIPAVEQAVQRHIAGLTEAYDMEYRHRHKTQGWVWMHARAKVLARDAQGRPLLMAGTLVDIQARKEAEARILELNATLEARVQARTEELARALDTLGETREDMARAEARATLDTLVASVSQELHTPLGNSAIAVQNLADRGREFRLRLDAGPLRRSELLTFVGQVQDNAELAQRNLARAAHLLDTFRQIGAEPGGEQEREIDLADWLQSLTVALAPALRLRGHALRLGVPAGLRLTTRPGPLGQVLVRLLQHLAQHALAEGQAGTLTLGASPAEGHLLLLLGDDGPGLPPEAQAGLSTLAGVASPLLRRAGGEGAEGDTGSTLLAMAVVDKLVRKDLGGSIRVVGLPGPGTRFELRLPLKAPVAPPPTPATP